MANKPAPWTQRVRSSGRHLDPEIAEAAGYLTDVEGGENSGMEGDVAIARGKAGDLGKDLFLEYLNNWFVAWAISLPAGAESSIAGFMQHLGLQKRVSTGEFEQLLSGASPPRA